MIDAIGRAALRALLTGASPRPWKAQAVEPPPGLFALASAVVNRGACQVARFPSGTRATADADLAAAAVNALGYLLEALDFADAELAKLREERRQYHWYADVFGGAERTLIVAWLRDQADKVAAGGGTDVQVAMIGTAAACIEGGRHFHRPTADDAVPLSPDGARILAEAATAAPCAGTHSGPGFCDACAYVGEAVPR